MNIEYNEYNKYQISLKIKKKNPFTFIRATAFTLQMLYRNYTEFFLFLLFTNISGSQFCQISYFLRKISFQIVELMNKFFGFATENRFGI